MNYYKSEFEALKNQFQQEDQRLKKEASELKERYKTLKKDVREKRYDYHEVNRLRDEMTTIEDRLDAIRRDRISNQTRYIDQSISMLERQKGESVFESYSDKIDSQIAELRNRRRRIQDQLD